MGSLHVDEDQGIAGMFDSFTFIRFLHTGTDWLWIQAKPTHQNIIRLAPPLVITEEEIKSALDIIKQSLVELPTLSGKKEDAVVPSPEKEVKIGVDN